MSESGIQLFASEDVTAWMKASGREIYLGDVLDETNSDALGVGFARYAPGEANDWVVTYDEVLVVTSGSFSVTTPSGEKTTATAGEVIFLPRNSSLRYAAEEHGAELVYVMYPQWTETQLASDHAELLDTFQPAHEAPRRLAVPGPEANVAFIRGIWDPLERGESDDQSAFFDALAEDVVFTTPLGEVHGKDALIAYFTHASETMDFEIFVRPLEYYSNEAKVVIAGAEKFTIKATGETHHADWTWIVDLDGDRIKHILAIQDLDGVADLVKDALDKAQADAVTAG